MNDSLREYVQTGSADAFRAIVETHVDAVYSQCLRQLRDRTLAEDVTQMVFIALAKKAATISDDAVLGGWLFNATRFCCRNAQRVEMRRRKREQKVAAMRSETIQPTSEDHSEAEALLDDAIARLSTRERDAIVLRYFQNKSMRDLAETLRISEDAAKQRVCRAVDRLRIYFADQGVAMPSAAVAGILGAAVKPAGSDLARVTAATAIGKSAGASWSTLSLSKVAAGIALATVLTAGGIVGERLAAGNDSPVAANPTTAPATQPIGQATPTDALRKLSLAIRADNLAMIDSCLTDDGTDPEVASFNRAVFHLDAAVYHLYHAWNVAFKIPVNVPEFSFRMFNNLDGGFETLIDKTLDAPNGPDVKIDGNAAMVRIGIAREIFTGSGPDRDAAQGRWSDAMLVLTKSNGDWKLNTDRSFTIMVNLNAPASNDPKYVTMQKLQDAFHDGLDKVARDIENGTITTPNDAAGQTHDAAVQASESCGVRGDNINIMPVLSGY